MSIQSLNEDLAALERDVRALVKETNKPADDVNRKVRTVEEEVVAAEFIATEETIENVSGVLAALSQIGEIHNEQIRSFFTDHRDTLKALMEARSPLDLARLGFEHWNRRATHIADGLTRTVQVISSESRRATGSISEMWKPFVELVRGDWAVRR
ncbi:MAG TPA: DUF948 domain-containing protein [Pseudomonadales bacterium]|nr:DUF948 domain-containing protein [Pseudomonadales bacterium]